MSHADLKKIAQQLGIHHLEKPKNLVVTADEVVCMITEQTRERNFLTALNNFITVLNHKKKELGKKLEVIQKVPHYSELGN